MLDTWFSSAIWPFATLGWPDDTPELRAFYPTSFLTTAREILFLWVARMIMTGLEFAGDVPFRDVYVHSVIQARDGRRMSKSLGTGIDPLEEIDVHGADALRFGLLAMSSTQDVRYSDAKVQQGARPGQQALERSRLVLSTRPRAESRRNGPTRPMARGPLDPFAAGGDDRLGDREARGIRLRPRRPGGLRVLLVGALRLVPGDRQAAPLRGRGRGLGDAALGAGADPRPAAPADALRHRGDLVLPPGPRGPPRRPPVPARPRSRCSTPRRRPRSGGDRADPPPARLARPGRGAGRQRCSPLAPRGSSRRSSSAASPASSSGEDGGDPLRRSARSRSSPRPRSTPRRSPRGWRSAARSCAPRSRGPRANSPTRSSSPSAPPEVVEEEREKLERYRAELEELAE